MAQGSVTDALQRAVQDLRLAAIERQVRVDVAQTDERLWVDCSDGTLRQLLLCLLSNAIKFSTPRGRVSVTTQGRNAIVVITVADEGYGMDEAAVSQVFDIAPEWMSPPTGTVLRLGVARMLVEALDGQLDAWSEGPGHGATFVLSLPAATPASNQRGTT